MAVTMTEPPRTTGRDDRGRSVVTLELKLADHKPEHAALAIQEQHPDIVVVKHYTAEPADGRIVADLIIPDRYFDEGKTLTLVLTDESPAREGMLWSKSFAATKQGQERILDSE